MENCYISIIFMACLEVFIGVTSVSEVVSLIALARRESARHRALQSILRGGL